jgi:hypothetical protein
MEIAGGGMGDPEPITTAHDSKSISVSDQGSRPGRTAQRARWV